VSDLGTKLDETVSFLKRFVVLQQPEAFHFLALWVAHTHAFEASITTVYPRITSAERESGKTRTFEALALLVRRPWLCVTVSTAVVFRKGDRDAPTLLLDEIDNLDLGDRAELLGVLNAGYRFGMSVPRCTDKGEIEEFDVFFPKAFSGLAGGRIPDTLHSRSVVIRLIRRKPEEPIERFYHVHANADASPLRDWFAEWALADLDVLAAHLPELPDELGDRQQESWLPLLAIAERAGGEWPERARKAAITLSGPEASDSDSLSRGVQLLGHILEIFAAAKNPPALTTAMLVAKLNESEEWPWGAYEHGAGLNGRGLAKLLRVYAIGPHTIRIGEGTAKGYRREQFEESWERYLPPDIRNKRNSVTNPVTTDPSNDGESYGVTDVTDKPGPESLSGEFGSPGYNDQGEEMAF
jgi:Protein of unknown function (DUF3631)